LTGGVLSAMMCIVGNGKQLHHRLRYHFGGSISPMAEGQYCRGSCRFVHLVWWFDVGGSVQYCYCCGGIVSKGEDDSILNDKF